MTTDLGRALAYAAALRVARFGTANEFSDWDQYGEWGRTLEGRRILIAVARYLAAHSPTESARFQTATTARRLPRGGKVHEAADEDSGQT